MFDFPPPTRHVWPPTFNARIDAHSHRLIEICTKILHTGGLIVSTALQILKIHFHFKKILVDCGSLICNMVVCNIKRKGEYL